MTNLLQRHFIILSLGTALLFLITAGMAMAGNRLMLTSSTIQQATANVSSLAMIEIMSKEIPTLADSIQASENHESGSVSSFVFELITSIHPGDLRSLLGRELPGLLTFDDARLIVAGKGTGPADLYVEYPPPTIPELEVPDSLANPPKSSDLAKEQPQTEAPTIEEPTTENTEPKHANPVPAKDNTVFVYHTHNRESWLSETTRQGESIDHPTRNITLVGRHLGEALRDKGIGTEVNTDDIYQRLVDKGQSYPLSYAESLKTVMAATQRNHGLKYYFDIHRDSKPRDNTTIVINGKTYARLFFVIGMLNKNHEKNAQLAKELHALLEKKYPGLSRGVAAKSEGNGNNGEYNQSVSPGSLLLEVGGPENSVQECYNSVEAFADVFADFYWQAERVSAEGSPKADKR